MSDYEDIIAAITLRQAADDLNEPGKLWWGDSGVRVMVDPNTNKTVSLDEWLRARANRLDGGDGS